MAGALRKLFTNEEITEALQVDAGNEKNAYAHAAALLSERVGVPVSSKLVRYWQRNLIEVTKKNGEPYIGTTVLDRKIRNEEVKLRERSPADDRALHSGAHDNSCILHICDTHAPYNHVDMLGFLSAVKDLYRPTRVIHGGDEVDNHALSFHDSDPNLDAAGPELHKARAVLSALETLFPALEVVHSNHGSLVYRKALKAGIPTEYIKSYREILFPEGGGIGWSWKEQIRTTLPNGEALQFQHQCAGDIMNAAAHERCNIVLSHEHSKFEINYKASKAALYFGIYGGCLLDFNSLAFAYGKTLIKRPIIGCSVIVDSQPILVPMILDKHGRWSGEVGGVR